jgi:ABC-type phosphate/phosphonate transport system ATPase subunit
MSTGESTGSEPVLRTEHLGRKVEGKTIVDDISVAARHREVQAIVGPSGSGKSSFLRLLAARELGVGPEECLAIEDSPAGVRAALVAGTEIVAVTTDLTRQKFRDTNLLVRSHIVDEPSTLPATVSDLLSAHG